MKKLLLFILSAVAVLQASMTAQTVTLNSTNFPDANFRAALTQITGVAEGGTFDATAITSLNVSGKGITNITGIANFTELTELNLDDNQIPFMNLKSNGKLKVLSLRNNKATTGISAYNAANTTKHINFANNTPLEELYMSGCTAVINFSPIANTYNITALKILDLKDCPALGWSPAINQQNELVYLDLTNNGLTKAELTNLSKLETLILANNPSLHGINASSNAVTLAENTPLMKLDASGCTNWGNFKAISETYKITSLTWLSLKNCTAMKGWSLGITKQTGLKYLDMSNTASPSTNSSSPQYGVNYTNSLPKLTQLDTLIIANNSSLAYADVSNCSKLKYFDISGCDLTLGTQTSKLPQSVETFIAHTAKASSAGNIENLPNLKTVDLSGNSFVSQTIINCPQLETLTLSNNAKLTTVAFNYSELENLDNLPNIVADECSNLAVLSIDGNKFKTVPELPSTLPATINCLSMKNNQFPATYAINGNTQLAGLDLGENNFTSLTVENSAMSALALSDNANLAELHLHGNANLKKTASATGISAAQGLYIKGLSALKVLDIENSNFSQLGQESSTSGCTGLETLKAAHNKFTTFSNAYTSFADGSRKAEETRSSLEHLTGLKYLDLSNNLLQDSLHLHKNTLLETLIVRNNRTITEYSDNSVVRKQFHTPGDPGEFNDTVGLRMLNLIYNKELKYIDISYTGIHHFARDGRLDKYKEDYYMANFAKRGNETAKNREPHYLLISNCNKLEEFYADYNGMKSAGFLKNFEGQGFDYLKRISMIETRGQDSYAMQGSWNPNGKDGCPNVEYINVANSDLDSVGVTKLPHLKYLNVSGNWTKNNWSHWSSTGVGHTLNLKANGELVECVADDCPHLVIAQANDKTNLTSLSLNNNPDLKQVYVPNTGLARIDAEPYGHPDPNPDTRTQLAVGNLGLAGLNTATNLELLYCEDNSNLTSLNVDANTNLKYLHAYNNAYGDKGLNLSKQNLKSAWVSNSGLTSLLLNGATALDTLKCYDNAALTALDVRASGAMRYMDLARCHVSDLNLSANSALEYFDCSNNEKCSATKGNWLSDLNFASTALQTVVANNNNLYNITLPEELSSLTRMEFAHNHINGIDLSGATSLAPEAIVDVDNGRTITAECAPSPKGRLYYFQLDANAGKDGGKFLNEKESEDVLKGKGRPSLAEENFSVANVDAWGNGVQGTVVGSREVVAIGDIKPEKVFGKIAVLSPTTEDTSGASGRAEYTYNNGRSTSTFYLDWSANASIVTEVEDLNVQSQEVVSVVYYNVAGQPFDELQNGVNIVVKTLRDGTTVTSKVVK